MTGSEKTLRPLPLGSVSFETLREASEIYVDKTDRVAKLAAVRRKLFISRPRRFGKSLLLTTFKSLFQNGLKHFQGLAIESQWQDKTYPVVHLDFSRLKSFESEAMFRREVESRIAQAYQTLGFSYDPASFIQFFDQLEGWLMQRPPMSYVLLVDEYDAPLTEHLDDVEVFRKIRRVLASFYAVVKTTEGSLRFFFMTGITKFNQTGLFSELNITDDYSYVSEYSTLLGYTEDEIRQYFGEYVNRAADVMGISADAVMNGMRLNYDGYCFDSDARQHVYNPWSVLHFLELPSAGFENYWIKSGGLTSGLFKYFKTRELRRPEDFEREKRLSKAVLEASASEDNISDVAFLTQTGYLTIKRRELDDYYVGYPNDEVTVSMANLYTEQLLGGNSLSGIGVGDVRQVLAEGSLGEVVAEFNKFLLSLSYLQHPVRDESTCRGFLQAFLKGARLAVQVESHNALGRSDLEVDAGRRHWVFEIKFLPEERKATEAAVDACLKLAEKQIRERCYGQQQPCEELCLAVVVYSARQRQLVGWRQVQKR